MAATEHNDDSSEPMVPAGLEARLKQFQSPRPFIPGTVDDAILRAARKHLAGPQPRRSLLFQPWTLVFNWRGLAGITLASVLVLVGFGLFGPRPRQSPVIAREDLNHDGRVDILDAFELARKLKAQPRAVSPALDVNGDGVVDERDVTSLAARAVQLPGGGGS